MKDALDTVNAVVAQLAFAVRGASSVAFLASILVLGGALAAGQTARIHDAVVLKTLGATRSRLLAAYIFEYSALGLCTALFGVAAGGAAAYAIVRPSDGSRFSLALAADISRRSGRGERHNCPWTTLDMVDFGPQTGILFARFVVRER